MKGVTLVVRSEKSHQFKTNPQSMQIWMDKVRTRMVKSLSLHVSCALSLCCCSTEVLPAEGSDEHGSR